MKTIIWDMGGTLVDTYPQVDRTLARTAWGDAASPEQLHEVAALRQESIAHAMDVLVARHGADRGSLESAYDALKKRWRSHPAPLMDGAEQVMVAVHRCGGLNLVATHRDRTSAQALIDALGITVDDLVCAPDGHARKPDPEMNLLLMRRHHLDAPSVLCVGDRPIDVQAADASGVRGALLAPDGVLPPGRLPEGSMVIRGLRELLPMVG